MVLLYIEIMLHLSHVKKMYAQPIHFTYELILWIQITRGKVNFLKESPFWHQVLNLWLSGHIFFHNQSWLPYRTWSFSWLHTFKPIQEASTLGDCFATGTRKLSRAQSRLSQSLHALKEFCCPSAWLTCSSSRAGLWLLSAAPGVHKRSLIQGPMLHNCSVQMGTGVSNMAWSADNHLQSRYEDEGVT